MSSPAPASVPPTDVFSDPIGGTLRLSSNPFFAIASTSSPWPYLADICRGGQGLWPLEALCLALLLDEDVRSDVALVVFLAQCLKTPSDMHQIDVYTISEVSDLYMNNRAELEAPQDVPHAQPRKVFGRYVVQFSSGFETPDFPFVDDAVAISDCRLIEQSQLPTKEAIGACVRAGEPFSLLYTAAFSASIDVAIILFTAVVNEVHDDTPLHDCSTDELISAFVKHGMKRFRVLVNTMLQAPQLQNDLAGDSSWYWRSLWECPSPEDAVFMVKTLNLDPARVDPELFTIIPLSEHHMAVIYAVHEAHGVLHDIDFPKLLPCLSPEAIEFIRIRGHLADEILSDASAWIDAFSRWDHDWRVERLQYLKDIGASFAGAGGFFGARMECSMVMSYADLLECLKFCIDNDPIFPYGFSPSTTVYQLLSCKCESLAYRDQEASHRATAVKYIRQLALQHDLLAPDPVTEDSLLTAAVRYAGRRVEPVLRFDDLDGEPTVFFDLSGDRAPVALKIVAPGDSQPLLAVFVAIEAGNIIAVDFLLREFDFNLFYVRHPVRRELVGNFARSCCNHANMLDWLTTLGVLGTGRFLLHFTYEKRSVVQLLHFLKYSDLDPFDDLVNIDRLISFWEATSNFKAICAFVWCMCNRYPTDPRWRPMLVEFICGDLARGMGLRLQPRRMADDQDTSKWYARIFFLLQRSGVIQPNFEPSSPIHRCVAAARESGNELLVAAASIDYTVETFVRDGKSIELTFKTASEMPLKSSGISQADQALFDDG